MIENTGNQVDEQHSELLKKADLESIHDILKLVQILLMMWTCLVARMPVLRGSDSAFNDDLPQEMHSPGCQKIRVKAVQVK